MSNKIYGAISLTGGGAGALDAIDGATLADGDMAIVITSSRPHIYRLNASSGAAENSPLVITPDTNAGTKRWLLSPLLPYFVDDYGTPGTAPTLGAGATGSIAQGDNTTIFTGATYAVISGGRNNDITHGNGDYAVIGGGNNNNSGGQYSVIGGGDSNDITNGATYSVVGGGSNNNIASGSTCSVISGGKNNDVLATIYYSSIGGGYSNEAGGHYSFIAGGSGNKTYGYASQVGGQKSKAYLYAQRTLAGGYFGDEGDAQLTQMVARKITTDATANVELFLDGNDDRMVLPANRTWGFRIMLGARQTAGSGTVGDSAIYEFKGGIKRDGSNNTALVGTVTKTVIAEDVAAWDAQVTADDTNESLKIDVTGEAGKTIHWVACIELVEVG